ncbi:hypothetical protein ACPPVW_18370 [Leifsonia sp. McL0607]|uniref:hypothetical protein n=1 Tax=Leifsonia sp. McL0607 TaxID=3415672 RepID=UPI003CF7FEC9
MKRRTTVEDQCCRQEQERRRLAAEYGACSWWKRSRRRAILAELETLGDLDVLAGFVARRILLVTAGQSLGDGRNPFHASVLENLDVAAARLSAWCTRESMRDRWARYPAVFSQLTPAHAAVVIRDQVQRLQTIACDQRFYVERFLEEDRTGVRVQHAASGLRAEFTIDPDPPFGTVYSKPYRLGSIAPEDRGRTHQNWEPYTRLGIGKRIYLIGAAMLPTLRWSGNGPSDSALHARRGLHAADPHRWKGPCGWCRKRDLSWYSASPTDFAGHPITPIRFAPTLLTNQGGHFTDTWRP